MDSEFFKLFFGILAHPKIIFKKIVEENPDHYVWRLAIFISFLPVLNPVYYIPLIKLFSTPTALLVGFILFPILSLLVFFINSWIVFYIGKLLGGKGTYKELRAAYAWSYPPIIIGIIFMLLGKVNVWISIFGGHPENITFSPSPTTPLGQFFEILFFFFSIWGFVLGLLNIAQSHKISIWGSINIFLIISALTTMLIGLVLFIFPNILS